MSPATSLCLRRILLTGALIPLAAPSAVAGQVWGDVTRDGTINSADALSVLSYSVGLPAPDHDYGLADVSAEGTISTLDALIILQYTVGMDLPQFRVGQPAGDDGCPEGDDCVIPAEATVFDLAANIAYDNDQSEQRLDVYTPPGAGPFPVVLVLHGGAWRAGSENDADVVRFAKQVVTLGYAAVSVQYRLANSADRRWPAQIHDVRCAVRWIRRNASTRPDAHRRRRKQLRGTPRQPSGGEPGRRQPLGSLPAAQPRLFRRWGDQPLRADEPGGAHPLHHGGDEPSGMLP